MPARRILVIDDENDIREIAQLSLEMMGGWTVLTARSGQEGIDKAIAAQPEAILLDVMMPVLDGYETCRRLKRDPETKNIPVVLLTAKGRDLDKRLGYEVGAVDYIVKPFSPSRLIERIQEILGVRK